MSLGQTASSRRYLIMALLFVTVVINYLDRSNLSIAAPSIASEFGLHPVQLGVVFSAFGWTYTPLQIPGGWLVDRVHPRVLYPLTILFWSIATLSLGLSTGLAMLIVLRMTVGLFEVPSFLMNNRIATTWFGERERATCIAVYTSAEFVGLAFLTPLLAWLKVTFGWPSVFFFTGALGLAWSLVFWRSYRDPAEFPGVNQAEIQLIRSSGGIPDLSSRISTRQAARAGSLWQDFAVVLGRRKLWGIYFGHFAWGTTSTFFLTWFPTYLVTYRHLDFIKAGFYASLPFLGAFVGVLCSGTLSDWLYRRGFSLSVARKTPIIGGLALSTSIIGANFVDRPALIILFLSLAFFANGLASIHWSLVSATAPERLIGLTSGVFNGVGGLAGISAPIIIGLLLRGGDFTLPLTFIACIALLGACSYIFVVGKLERVDG
ncbi:MAG TPA: MFS transporter [Acetobacteraceae bacterium]|jgi:ACS family D-galactonate transporter-like MFS transporter